ncbi:hypothetical protein NDU88_006833 [Pleurodeles waltl]|uniref:Secreted protein n=1 Tax=Pleurodeles waltl TaxID=8319 RepID=A0AAV7UNQ0_PLEWA|nr:hypothetical protein NDU88_006833 [Pleurodeles waltl]
MAVRRRWLRGFLALLAPEWIRYCDLVLRSKLLVSMCVLHQRAAERSRRKSDHVAAATVATGLDAGYGESRPWQNSYQCTSVPVSPEQRWQTATVNSGKKKQIVIDRNRL